MCIRDSTSVDPAVAAFCATWNGSRGFTEEGTWTGSVNTCDPGDVESPGRPNTLEQLNLMRWLAGLPEVSDDALRNTSAQECALIQQANDALSHFPAEDWPNGDCIDLDAGVESARQSNIASTRSVFSVDLYMVDFGAGNAPSMGHRRWLLSNSLGPVGIGSADSFSCIEVIGGQGNAGAEWTAWPPPGLVLSLIHI